MVWLNTSVEDPLIILIINGSWSRYNDPAANTHASESTGCNRKGVCRLDVRWTVIVMYPYVTHTLQMLSLINVTRRYISNPLLEMLLPESQTRAVLIHGTARGSCLQSNKQSCVHMQVPVKCMKLNQEPVLGCLATDSVSAEFSLHVSPFANKSSRDAWTFCGVRACEVCSCTISWASCCNQASRASAHTCIASLVIFTPG